MNKFNNVILMSVILVIAGCADRLTEEKKINHKTVFTASIESDSNTKTYIGAEESGYYPILWSPGDKIAIFGGTSVNEFITESGDGNFTGVLPSGSSAPYYALYPYTATASIQDTKLSFPLPGIQTYKAGGFENNTFPMVAVSNTHSFNFKNLCGILKLNLIGNDTITKVLFSSNLVVSGKASVNMNYGDTPSIIMAADGSLNIVLDCSGGVKLSDEPTPFYIVLPPGNYSEVLLKIYTKAGKYMKFEIPCVFTINRAKIKSTDNLTVRADESFYGEELDIEGTANCYVVSRAGTYTFNALIIGNGNDGIIANRSFHAINAVISPVSAMLLWEDVTGLITDVVLKEGKISFKASNGKGNALIAVKDGNGVILWSWHIWATDKPANQKYYNNNLVVMDRNLGAVSVSRTAARKDVIGLYYQFGRKDPFRYDAEPTAVTTSSSVGTIGYTVTNPDIYIIGTSSSNYDWLYSSRNNYLWGNPSASVINGVYPIPVKTIYDPCPPGYVTPPRDTWMYYSSSDTKYYNYGHEVTFSAGNTTWIPFGGMRGYNGSVSLVYTNYNGFYWLSTGNSTLLNNTDILDNSGCSYRGTAQQVRCAKYVDRTSEKPPVETRTATNVTASAATIAGSVLGSNGGSPITSYGLQWGTTESSLTNTKTFTGSVLGPFEYKLTGLNKGQKYYYRAYATNYVGTENGEIRSFTTTTDEEPDWFSKRFYKKTVALRFTATWCGYCPNMGEIVLTAQQNMPDRIVPLNCHPSSSNSAVYFTGTDALSSLYGITGYPTLIVDGRAIVPNTSVSSGANILKGLVNEAITDLSPVTGIAFSSSVSNKILTVPVTVYSKESANYLMCVALLEDSITTSQSNYYGDNYTVYVHTDIPRIFLTAVTGDDFIFSAYGIKEQTFSCPVPENVVNISNCKIVVYLLKPTSLHTGLVSSATYLTGNTTYVDNCAVGAVGETVALRFE